MNTTTSSTSSRSNSNPFSGLQISEENAQDLKALARIFVQRTIAQYERFLDADNGQVDTDRWRFVKDRGNVRSFVERRSYYNSERAVIDEDRPSDPEVPVFLINGTLKGEWNDAMYGMVSPTEETMRIKTSYLDDRLVRAKVLATLVKSDPADPFRSMTIKWAEKGRPLQAIFKNRDYVYMEATGVEYLRNGEKVGYQLMHSVHFPETPEIDGVVRGNLSICGLARQKSESDVEIYSRGYLNPSGGIQRMIAINSICEGILVSADFVHCAKMRKLGWKMRQRSSISPPTPVGECSTCGKSRFRSALKGVKRSVCKICYLYVCSSCKVEKKLSFFLGPNRSVVRKSIRFCQHCVDDAFQANTLAIAREEIETNSGLDSWNDCYGSSSPGSAEPQLNEELLFDD